MPLPPTGNHSHWGLPSVLSHVVFTPATFPRVVDELLLVVSVSESNCTSANPGPLTFSSPRFAFPTRSSEAAYTNPSLEVSGRETVMIISGSGVPGGGGRGGERRENLTLWVTGNISAAGLLVYVLAPDPAYHWYVRPRFRWAILNECPLALFQTL